jgi:hypothetical protein
MSSFKSGGRESMRKRKNSRSRERSVKRKIEKEQSELINLYYQVRLYSLSPFSCRVTLVDMQSVWIRSGCSLDGFVFYALRSVRRCI